MRLEPWWPSRASPRRVDPLTARTTADAVVVGGGFAGLHAALRLAERGADVVLLEQACCGGGMSGISSGFLTPDSEIELHQLISRFGARDAATLWAAAVEGAGLVVRTARTHGFPCELEAVDSLFLGIGRSGVADVAAEAAARTSLGYQHQLYDAPGLAAVHPGGYAAGVRYGDTWTLDPFAYCQALRGLLLNEGVRIYEDSAVTRLDGTTAVTRGGVVTAKNVVIAANRVPASLSPRIYPRYYTAQTFLTVSAPLRAEDIATLFPEQPLQCWDSRWIYSYYRLTGDRRLLLGGGSLMTTLRGEISRSSLVIERTITAFRRRFPQLASISFDAYWPGLIDVTADLLPVAAADPEQPGVFVVFGCGGLPWAAWCGDDIARGIAGEPPSDAGRLLGWDRKAAIPVGLQTILGKRAAFAIDLLVAKSRGR